MRPKQVLASVLAAISIARADDIIYQDGALSSTWQDWSWSSTITYDATDLAEGTSSILVNSTQYAALSVKDNTNFQGYAGLQFDIAGDNPDVSISISCTTDNAQSASFPLSAFGANITSSGFTTLLMNFNDLPGSGTALGNDTWDRITFQAGTNGAVYHIDNIIVLSEIIVQPEILSAEPVGVKTIAVTTKGAADISTIKVTLNNKAISVVNTTTMNPVDTPSVTITYLTLSSAFAAGNLSIATDNGTFSFALPPVLSGTISLSGSYPINPLVYGVNFPTDASYITNLGITLSRWGGNAVTAYNPNGGFTNAGADWYFENRDSDSADDWIGWVNGAGSGALLTIPSLDWVSKDNASYSYPKTLYPDQKAFDPYNADAGDGQFPNGTAVSPVTDQNRAYSPWNTSLAQQWLQSLQNIPKIVTVDNEIEIASSTHQDMHPDPVSYDEELARVVNVSTMAKQALPNVLVAAPSTCSWWFYWRSEVGDPDVAAHNGSDFLPWFLTEMHAHDLSVGKRHLDYLDLHYYFQADTSANDAAAKALRLRMSRSLWDPTYVDESWVATSTGNSQPNSSIVMLIPRIHTLLDEHYPGTKFSISEWSSTADEDLTGGLLTADMLGIFGKFKLDAATYWATPDENGPVGLAYWLYRGYGTHFGGSSLPLTVRGFDPDTLGIYAAADNGKNLSLVVVNKNPSSPVALNLSGLPKGTYFLRHFGGQAGIAKFQTTVNLDTTQYLTIPAYTAVFLRHTT